MRKPRTLIVDDDKSFLEGITLMLGELGHTVIPYRYVDTEDIEQIKENPPDLMLLDQLIKLEGKPGILGVDIAKRFQEDKRTRYTPKVIITGAPKEQRTEIAEEALRLGLLKEVVGKPIALEDLVRISGYASVPLNIGFVSLGRLAQKSIEILFKEHPEYVETVKGVSLTGMHKEEDLRISLGIEDEQRFRVYGTLEELAEQSCDIVLVSSSNSAESRVESGRNWLWNNEKALQYNIWTRIIQKESGLTRLSNNTNSLYIIATNPIGANISLAEKLGMPTERITGLSVIDTVRAKRWLKQRYFEQFNEQLNDEDVKVRVIGQHGLEIPLYGSIKIKGKSPEQIGLSVDMERFRHDVREEGGKVMESVKNLTRADMQEALYRGVPEAFVNLIGTFCKRRQPSESLYSKRNIMGSIQFNGPSEVTYSEAGITVKPKAFGDVISEEEFNKMLEQNRDELHVQGQVVSEYVLEREKESEHILGREKESGYILGREKEKGK